MKKIIFLLLISGSAHAQRFRIQISPAMNQPELDGRMLLLLSKTNKAEPLFQISDAANTQLIFGIDVEGWKPEKSAEGRRFKIVEILVEYYC